MGMSAVPASEGQHSKGGQEFALSVVSRKVPNSFAGHGPVGEIAFYKGKYL